VLKSGIKFYCKTHFKAFSSQNINMRLLHTAFYNLLDLVPKINYSTVREKQNGSTVWTNQERPTLKQEKQLTSKAPY